MRILQLSSADSLGGGERHLADLVAGLSLRGHEVYAAVRPKSPLIKELATMPRERLCTLPLRNALDVTSARDLAAFVRKNDLQIVHAHMARDYPLAAYAVRQNPGARLIVTRHVLFPLNRLHRFTLSQCSFVIAVSEAVASALRESGTVAPDKIVVVLNGIDVAKFAAARQNFNRESFLNSWQLPANCLLVGTIGELSPLKGQKDLLEAAPEILQKHPQTYFVIAGMDHSHDKRNRRALEEQIREANLSGSVKLVSWLDDLAQLYCALDVFVSSSHSESFGLAIAEAMASATAVVATETEGAKEIISDGKTGLLVPIGDEQELAASVSLLLDDEQKRVRMGREAQLDVTTRFSLERMVAETEEVYRNSLGR